MPTFALICEGVTDQIIIDRIISEFCCDIFDDYVDINPLQPLRDTTDAYTAPHGGWERVLEYCEHYASDALFSNDYVVIHIDTDQGEHPNFGLQLTQCGNDRIFSDLISDAVAIIKRRLSVEIEPQLHRIIFAISVHTIESWILLCLFDKDEVKNSIVRLNRLLSKANSPPLSKDRQHYSEISREIRKKKLVKLSQGSHSLGHFLSSLKNLTKGSLKGPD